ncbi:MAG: PQQ-binding-like beta-propeller repeat protein [Verrucomicrobiaceae bacterium]
MNSSLLATLSLMAFGSTTFLQAKDWPQWRGPDRTGLSSETGINKDWEKSPPKLLWNVEGAGRGFSSVSVADGVIYTTGNFDGGQGASAFSQKDGSLLWQTPVTDHVPEHGYGGARSVPTVDGDRIYLTTSNGVIACLSTKGNVLWSKDFKEEWDGKMMSGWGFSESPLVDGDRVICTPGSDKAFMVSLDKMTGATKWKTKLGDVGKKGKDGAGYGSIVISNGGGVKQYVQMTGRGVIGVRAKDGRFMWNYNDVANSTANIPTPIVEGDYVFCSTGYGTGSALLKLVPKGSGAVAEEVYFLKPKTLQNHHGGMVLVDGHIYCAHKHNGGDPICVELKTGEVKWGPEKGPGHGSACVTYVDGHLIYRYQSGHVALIEASPKGYRLKGSFMPAHQEAESWAHPVVADGKLYLREQDRLMCYEL